MATTLALAMRASMSAAGVVSGANDAAKAMDKMGAHARQMSGDLSAIKWTTFSSMATQAFSQVSGVITSTAHSLTGYTTSVANALDATMDLSNRIGMGVESLQALQMAAKLSGVDDVTGAVQKLNVAIGQASESGNTEAFTRLGLDFAQLQSLAPEEQFQAIQQAISQLNSPAEKAAAAVGIFGRSGVDLLPLMEQNLAEIESRMRMLGAIVGQDQVAAIGQMNDALDMVSVTIAGIVGQVAGNLAPVVTEIAETFLSFVEGYKGVAGEGGTGIANAITEGLFKFVEAFAGVIDAAIARMDQIVATLNMGRNVVAGAARFVPGLTGASLGSSAASAVMSGGGTGGAGGAASQAVRDIRERFRDAQSPEAQAQRAEDKKNRDAERKAASDARAAADKDAKAAEEAEKDAKKLRDETRTAEEKHAEEMKRIDELRARNAIDEETYQRAKAQADERLQQSQERANADAQRAQEKAAREAEQAQQKEKQRMEKVAAVDEKMAGKQEEIDKINAEKAASLDGKSNEALRANDIRSSEGMAQFLALATGREDPAIEENRKTNQKLDEIRKELVALQQEKVDILGAAA